MIFSFWKALINSKFISSKVFSSVLICGIITLASPEDVRVIIPEASVFMSIK